MATVMTRLGLVEEFHASNLSRQEFRDMKAEQGILISKTRLRQWIEDYKSGRLSKSVTNTYRIPRKGPSDDDLIRIVNSAFCERKEFGYKKVEVFQSRIVNAGLGLRARVNISAVPEHYEIKKKYSLCRYVGKRIWTTTAVGAQYSSDYCLEYCSKWTIDSFDSLSCFARYINDPLDDDAANVIFVKHPTKIAFFVIPIKDISAGEEILVAYGKSYWVDFLKDSERFDTATVERIRMYLQLV
jgi:hypothetical protein